MWVDMHCHLDKLEEGPEEALKAAQAAGVDHVVTIGTEPDDLPVVLRLAKSHWPRVSCTLGIHPHEGVQYSREVENYIRQHLQEPQVIAVGEIGLDYYYEHSPQKEQREAFAAQMQIAADYGMPVEIHTRDAESDTVDILKDFEGKVRGIIHCFTGSQWLAEKCLELGYNISISGVVTFKNAEGLRATVRSIPLDRLHVETDAPFLAPVPQRGKPNTPAFVVHTAAKVAELKGVSLEELAQQTRRNACALFPKMPL
ncbi:MAG: TatD family hydrolase [Bdellovibrionaceae bacterium]|nr:TatD family hydrolase [Pseudobdellovibrionaceae bacterium]